MAKYTLHNCETCGKEFHGRTDRVYCSRECRRPWNKGLVGIPANRPKNGSERICKGCGQSFYAQKSAKSVYCSQACYFNSRWNHDGTCRNCGKPSDIRFCSPECQKQFWNTNGYVLQKQRRNWERKIELIRALGGRCTRCGNDDMRVLAVHHINPDTKVQAKDKHWNWSRRFTDWAANQNNLELLCANCHRILTWYQMGYGVGLELPESSFQPL